MRDKQDGDSARAQLVHFAHAALSKIEIAHGQCFIHQQDLGIQIDGHGESQPHHHAARVSLHGPVDEVANFGELLDVFIPRINLPLRQSQD